MHIPRRWSGRQVNSEEVSYSLTHSALSSCQENNSPYLLISDIAVYQYTKQWSLKKNLNGQQLSKNSLIKLKNFHKKMNQNYLPD